MHYYNNNVYLCTQILPFIYDVIMKRTILLLVFSAFLLSMNAQQEVNMKFGKPTKEEMSMTEYAPEPDADAVVLCRLTNVEYTVQTNGYLVDYREKFRIKVLKPEGSRFATVTVPYLKDELGKGQLKGNSKFSLRSSAIEMGTFSSNFDGVGGSLIDDAVGNHTNEDVEDLKATAFNLENGKVVKTTMKKDAITTEKIDDQHYQVKFTIPEVRQGTVIEYEYTVHSELFYLLHDWYAQCEIPVVYACLDMDIPSYLIFNVEEHGIQRLVCKCETGTMRYKLESDAIAAPVTISTNHFTCIGRNLTGMPKDSFVWNENDHYAGITAELKGYSLRGTMFTECAKNWDQIDSKILDDDDLGKRLNDHSPLGDELAAAKVSEIADERERAAKVFQLVMSRVKWNGKYELWPKKTSETLAQRGGSNADINLLLIQSLHDAGLDASPVVLRTRDEGLMPYNFPTIAKLTSYVVAVTLSNGTNVFMDASTPNGYLNVLAEPLLVERARLVKKGKKSQWVNLQKLQKSQTTTMIEATLSADGTYSGTQTTLYKGLAAAKYRQSKGINEYAADATEVVEFNKKGTVSDGKISFNPFNNPPMSSNPFTATKRLMPVEFPCTSSDQVIVNITLPEGYVMESAPQQKSFSTPDKGLEGRLFTGSGDGKVQVQYQFNVNKISHSEKNYAALRDMYDLFTKFSNEQLVIKKAN